MFFSFHSGDAALSYDKVGIQSILEEVSRAPLFSIFAFLRELHAPNTISADNIMSNPLRVADTELNSKWMTESAITTPSLASYGITISD